MKINKTFAFLLVFFILLSAAFMTYYYKTYKTAPKRSELPYFGGEEHRIGDFRFVSQDNTTVTKENLKDKIFVVEYFFTTCKGICPKMNDNMARVYHEFKGRKDFMILSHTVDPLKDSTEALKAYSLKFEANPEQWLFLTGDKKELYDMARYSYLVTASDDTAIVDIQDDFIHTEKFVLVDKQGRIRGAYDGTDAGSVNQLIGDIRTLLEEQGTN